MIWLLAGSKLVASWRKKNLNYFLRCCLFVLSFWQGGGDHPEFFTEVSFAGGPFVRILWRK